MIVVVPKAKQTTVGATYPICDGVSVTGAGLIGRISRDGGAWQLATNSPVETDPVNAPGHYSLTITSGEMNAGNVQWVMVDSATSKSIAGGTLLTEQHSGLFETIFGEPATDEDKELRQSFFDCLADSVLRRSLCLAEQSDCGDPVGLSSLLGAAAVLTQGQAVSGPDCNGQYFLTVPSACQGGSPIGSMRIVKNKSGSIIAIVPTVGPNSIADSSLTCWECPDTGDC